MCSGEYGEHVFELVEADEFVFAVEGVDAGEAAESFGVALSVETDHDDLLALVGGALLAGVVVVLEAHWISIKDY